MYLIIAPCRFRGLGVRFPSTIIFRGFPTWYRIVVRIDALTLRGQGSNPLVSKYYYSQSEMVKNFYVQNRA
jgi:hypothetical protein